MEQLWGLPPGTIHSQPGYDAVRMFDALERGEVRAIWIIGTNPAATMPNLPKVRRALEKAELVIVQDAYYPTETTAYADDVRGSNGLAMPRRRCMNCAQPKASHQVENILSHSWLLGIR